MAFIGTPSHFLTETVMNSHQEREALLRALHAWRMILIRKGVLKTYLDHQVIGDRHGAIVYSSTSP